MPFTPIHMGPGMAVKALLPRHFSIIVFGLTQIAIDVEVLRYLMRGEYPLHRFWHTYLGATMIAVVFTLLGKPSSQWIKILWNRIAPKNGAINLSVSVPTTWLASFMGAFIGTYSHILLDSLYHGDMKPLHPWSEANHLYGLVSPHSVEVACVLLGIAGLAWYFAKQGRNGRKVDKAPNAQR